MTEARSDVPFDAIRELERLSLDVVRGEERATAAGKRVAAARYARLRRQLANDLARLRQERDRWVSAACAALVEALAEQSGRTS